MQKFMQFGTTVFPIKMQHHVLFFPESSVPSTGSGIKTIFFLIFANGTQYNIRC